VRGTIRERGRNRFQNARDIAQDIVVPETQNSVVVTGKPLIADHVMLVVGMLAPPAKASQAEGPRAFG
jgi:hypothetical protein